MSHHRFLNPQPPAPEPDHGWPQLYVRRYSPHSGRLLVERITHPTQEVGKPVVVQVAGRGDDSPWSMIGNVGDAIITSPANQKRALTLHELRRDYAPDGDPDERVYLKGGLIQWTKLLWRDMPAVPQPQEPTPAMICIGDGDDYLSELGDVLERAYKEGEPIESLSPVWAEFRPVRLHINSLINQINEFYPEAEGEEPCKTLVPYPSVVDAERPVSNDDLVEMVMEQLGGDDPETDFTDDEEFQTLLKVIDERVRADLAVGLTWGSDDEPPTWVTLVHKQLNDLFEAKLLGAYWPGETRPVIPHDWQMQVMVDQLKGRSRRQGRADLALFAGWLRHYFPSRYNDAIHEPTRTEAPAAAFMWYFGVDAPVGAPWVAFCEALVAEAIAKHLPDHPEGFMVDTSAEPAMCCPMWVYDLYMAIDRVVEAAFAPAAIALAHYQQRDFAAKLAAEAAEKVAQP